MGVRSLTVFVVALCLLGLAFAQDDLGGEDGGIKEDVKTAMGEESIFNVSEKTGMSPGVPDTGVAGVTYVSTLPQETSAAGSWSFELKEGTSAKEMSLLLYQVEGAVFGSGEIMTGDAVEVAAAGGSIEEGKLDLYVIPGLGTSVYLMDLTLGASSMAGTYRMYSSAGTSSFGTVMASR